MDHPAHANVEPRFGAGLTEAAVRRFQTILREECAADLSLPAAWSKALEVLSLVEMLLDSRRILEHPNEVPEVVRASSLLTDSES